MSTWIYSIVLGAIGLALFWFGFAQFLVMAIKDQKARRDAWKPSPRKPEDEAKQ
jgi:hypothetical protein